MTKWWKNAVIYQIYPKSFFDSDSNLWGSIFRRDYLQAGLSAFARRRRLVAEPDLRVATG